MKRYVAILGILLLATALPAAPARAGETAHPFMVAYGQNATHGLLLGSWSEGQWLNCEETRPYSTVGDVYRLYTPEGFQQDVTSQQAEQSRFRQTQYFTFTPASQGDFPRVGVSCPWDPMPRPVETGAERADYIELTRFILESKGLPDPVVRLWQVLHVDLDGDGAEEVLITALNHRRWSLGIEAAAGEYCVTYMLAREGDADRVQILAANIFPKDEKSAFPARFRILGVLDLNGNGSMEVILQISAYEFGMIEIYEPEGNTLKEVFEYHNRMY